MFRIRTFQSEENELAVALQRLADGLPLPLETARWPEPLRSQIAALAERLNRLRRRLEELAEERRFGEPLPEDSGFVGLTVAANRLLEQMQLRYAERQAVIASLDAMLEGDYDHRATLPDGNTSELLIKLNQLPERLAELNRQQQEIIARAEATAEFADALRGEYSVEEVSARALALLCKRTSALAGAFYVGDETRCFRRTAAYALSLRHRYAAEFHTGEGLLGQAIADGELVVVAEVPEDYLPLESGLAIGKPRYLLLWPIRHLKNVVAAVELASLSPFTPEHLAWLREVEEIIAVTLSIAKARQTMETLLAETQTKNEELRAQQEELRAQSEAMQRLAAELEEKNEAAMRLQAELEEKNELLQRQQAELEERNELLERQKAELHQRQRALEQASRYKSEFLANMSHELRTPLNSLLLLAGHLLDNEEGNLTEDQLESLAMIKKGGEDLLHLINDILDLSKIEAGQLKVVREPVEPALQIKELVAQLSPLAQHKGIALDVEIAEETPRLIFSDGQRLAQILKNLIGNAIKFTEKGGVTVQLAPIDQPIVLPSGRELREGIRCAVIDTGPGIPPERQREIFEAFQQGDGSITRKYGGTGLGLTISRQLARRLGGDILLESEVGKGSTFTLVLPLDGLRLDAERSAGGATPRDSSEKRSFSEHGNKQEDSVSDRHKEGRQPLWTAYDNVLLDDREHCNPAENTILVIEDDTAFARTLLKEIRQRGFKALAALTGEEGLALARHFHPSGIILDLNLPDMNGREVLEALKKDSRTRDIPVHVVSASDRDPELFAAGAIDFIQKPLKVKDLQTLLDRMVAEAPEKLHELLVVEDDEGTQNALRKLLTGQRIQLTFVRTGSEALQRLKERVFDGMLLDLGLPDMNGLSLLETLEEEGITLPVIVFTGQELDETEYHQLRAYSDHIVLKGEAGNRRLLDEIVLFLHALQNRANRPNESAPIEDDALFQGKRVLLVDDDVRNAFALNKILRKHGFTVILANDGQLALEKLDENPNIDLVLMDIMMPVMDGYEAMRRIRADERFRELPIIALTAKAMSDDRDKCLAAGATDYLAKPVDVPKLLSLMRLYLKNEGR